MRQHNFNIDFTPLCGKGTEEFVFCQILGDIVNQIMVSAFPSIVDVNFTATMEALLDGVAEG